VVLGFNTVKDMGLSLSVFDAFKNIKGTGNFDVSRFWQHSIACGIASRMLTRNYRTRYAGEAFVAGLLHDIGKVILNQYFHDEFMEIIRLASSGTEFDAAELEVIGTGHAQIGAWLAEKWNLPKIISSAILYHHDPWNSPEEKLFNAIIMLSDYLCHVSDYSYSGRNSPPLLQAEMWEIFQKDNIPVDEPDMENLLAEFQAEFDSSETFVNLLQEENK
ncbi:MAG: HDOD domain-containing protein, partial [Fibrobacter sp.]|nr:HDOD domain-containing protein [Fibrobacter sp.]